MALRLMDVKNQLDRHEAVDAAAHVDIQETRQDIKTIKENHLAHMQASLTKMETDMWWLKVILGTVGTASVGSLVTGVMNLILK